MRERSSGSTYATKIVHDRVDNREVVVLLGALLLLTAQSADRATIATVEV